MKRHLVLRLGAFVTGAVVAWGALSIASPATQVPVHVRWAPDLGAAHRLELERRFQLRDGHQSEPSAPTTWTYQLGDLSARNIRALVEHTQVVDTDGVDRSRYRPSQDTSWIQRQRRFVFVAASGLAGAVLFLVVPALLVRARAAGHRAAPFGSAMWADLTFAMSTPEETAHGRRHDHRVTAVILLIAGLISSAMTWLAGATVAGAITALLIVYAGGYVAGSLLVARVRTLSWIVVRTVSGLMLTSMAFLFSLVVHAPWFVMPAALLAVALRVRGRTAFEWTIQPMRMGWDGAAATALVAILMAPTIITFFRMAPGPFPQVFYNVDTAYSLEKVHALVVARSFPPPSLSNLGVVRTYHYGVHAMAALVARGSGLLPHHALFLVVLPLLAVGMVAAAVAAVRCIAPQVPLTVGVPLLLVAAPLLTRSFSDGFGPRLWADAAAGRFTFDWINADYVSWGILSNEAANTDFLILGTIAAVAAAPVYGWMLPAFLIGSSVLFKTTTGIALVAGLVLSETWRAIASKRYWPSGPLLLTLLVFATTFGAFYLVSFDSAFRVQPYLLDHIRNIGPGGLVTWRGVLIDTIWLLLPVLAVATAVRTATKAKEPSGSGSAPFLLMAIAPLVVVNTTRLVHVGNGGEGAGLDWVQIPHAVPFMMHAFALSLASARWHSIATPRRAAFLLASAVVLAPVVIAADTYSLRLLRFPESGHEFADNRQIAEALATIPTSGTIIVTNDLRYPADNFGREDRQMQIPAIFGHQAFSANFSYEPVDERRPLQELLQRPQWSDAIAVAARQYHWTHLLIHKDYVHPKPIPLRRTFENGSYAVYEFP